MRSLRIDHEMFDPYTHERLVNWSRCVRWGGPIAARCASLEGRYRRAFDDDSLRNLEEEEARRQPPALPPDEHDGLLVERTVCHPSFPKRTHALLAAHYVYRDLPRITCRILVMAIRDYDYEVCRAIHIVRNCLDAAHR